MLRPFVEPLATFAVLYWTDVPPGRIARTDLELERWFAAPPAAMVRPRMPRNG